jgi:hypothetical protein
MGPALPSNYFQIIDPLIMSHPDCYRDNQLSYGFYWKTTAKLGKNHLW